MQRDTKYMMHLFNRNRRKKSNKIEKIKLISIPHDNISTGQIGGYLLMLREKHGITMLGYEYKEERRSSKPCVGIVGRFIIYTCEYNTLKAYKYFEDRCPAIVEKECMEMKPTPHKFLKWGDDFEEVVPDNFIV